MHNRASKLLICTLIVSALGALSGCGGGGSSSSSGSGGSGNNPPTGTDITFTFAGGVAPTAAAAQIGTGSWTTATPQNGALTVTVPNGTDTYAIAYVCPTYQGMGPINPEFIIEAAVSDGTAYTVSCYQNPTTGTATGSADGSAISGATELWIVGRQSLGSTLLFAPSGTFSANLATGTDDVAVVATDTSNDVLGVKIVRSQTVPGAINGGNTITLSPSDATSSQSITVTNIPAGFATPAVPLSIALQTTRTSS